MGVELVFVVAPITIFANIIISIATIFVIRFWLRKIYRRVKDIDSILGHYYRKDIKTRKYGGRTK